MQTTPRPSLLSKARSFIAKSSVLAIAPLATVQVVEAATVIDAPAYYNASLDVGVISGGAPYFIQTAFSTTALPEMNSITGGLTHISGTFYPVTGMGSSSIYISLAPSEISGTPIGPGVTIPVAYNFTLSPEHVASSSVGSWHLTFVLNEAQPSPSWFQVEGSGHGEHSGTLNLVTALETTNIASYLLIEIQNLSTPYTYDLDMSIAYNAVPEPSAYALVLGISVLSFCAWRRRQIRPVA